MNSKNIYLFVIQLIYNNSSYDIYKNHLLDVISSSADLSTLRFKSNENVSIYVSKNSSRSLLSRSVLY